MKEGSIVGTNSRSSSGPKNITLAGMRVVSIVCGTNIDAATFAVTKPRAQDVQQRAAAPADDGAPSDGFPWGLAAAVAAVGAGALVLLRRRYAADTDSAESRSASSSNPTVP